MHNSPKAETNLIVSLVVVSIFLIAAVGFGAWAYSSRSNYKNNANQLAYNLVSQAISKQKSADANTYAEEAKKPLATYTGPQTYGSIQLEYPKTWSGYVDDSGQGQAQLDGYFNPGVVPAIEDDSSAFALRLQVVDQDYSDYVSSMQQNIQSGTLTAAPYALPKVPSQVGTMFSGAINDSSDNSVNGEEVALPLRGSTLLIYTLGTSYTSDFNNIILPNLTFKP